MADENADVEKSRPNIRIQIQNNFTENENMDVDNDENEDGEIVEQDEEFDENTMSQDASSKATDNVQIANKAFTIGINIFDKEEQLKLQERARRFALKPEEIKSFTDADLLELYESLGITSDGDLNVRFDAVVLHGIVGLSRDDILEYFANYAPITIEWVDNNSCNVTWVENISAARAIFYNSKAVNGMPAREPVDTFARDFLDNVEDEPSGKSILLRNREVELKVEELLVHNKPKLKNAVDISEIKIAIPPGYWRLGKNHQNTKCLLLRFALKTDKKPFKIENLGKYYKNLGTKSLMTENRKELKGIFERNRDLVHEKNPWGFIAKNWDKDSKFREPEYGIEPPVVETVSSSLQIRLGKKNNLDTPHDIEPQLSTADVAITEQEEVENRTKVKVPRMRMYADEEEEKLRRKRLLKTIKHHTEKFSQKPNLETTDLRNILRYSNKVPEEVIEIDSGSDETDLGGRLKSRTKQMVFTVERTFENTYQKDYRNRISPISYRQRIPPQQWANENRIHHRRSRSPITRYKSPVRRSSGYERSPSHRMRYGTLVSDRVRTRYKHRRRESDVSDGGFDHHKPKSRVAVVVKKPKKPTVASTIWSRVRYESESESTSLSESSDSEESSSSNSESSSESESLSESDRTSSSRSKRRTRRIVRPGFQGSSLLDRVNRRTSLKVTMANDKIRK